VVIEDVDESEQLSPPRRLRRWTLPLVFVVTAAVLGGVALVLQAAGHVPPPDAAAASPSRRLLLTCGETSDAPGACQFLFRQLAGRSELTEADHRSAGPAEMKVYRVVEAALPVPGVSCGLETGPPPGGSEFCRTVPNGDAPDPRRVEQALLAAGYDGAAVRRAGTGAPSTDALLYAVPVGNACIIGYQTSRGGSHIVLGRLPDHSCLSP
jgi:hypothetical protein